MGRKSEKSLLKQARVKEEKKQFIQAQHNVKKANSIADPLQDFLAFKKYSRNGLSLSIECKRVKDLPLETTKTMFELLKKNMESFYRSSDWGWDEEKKFAEMTEDAAWYLTAYNEENKIVGFSHFRFDIDYGYDVLYVYELQICEELRRKGVGKFMSQLLELIAFKNNMKKVRLTVFKHNAAALEFYRSMKYTLDETTPEDCLEETFCYIILSKPNKNISIGT